MNKPCFLPESSLSTNRKKTFSNSLWKRKYPGGNPAGGRKQVIAGVHPCDTNAILYLDKTFLGTFKDPHYEKRRSNTLIISLNCEHISPNCFCSSVGAGPFLKAETGYDMLLTDFKDEYLVEIKSERVGELFDVRGKSAGAASFELKTERKNQRSANLRRQ
jgi:hypothetical protein